MAKKLRKRRMPLGLLFILLLVPWIVMATVAATMSWGLGLPDYASIIIALASALVTTFLIRDHVTNRRLARSR